MQIVEKIRDKAKQNKKRIVLPESEDARVKEAVDFINKESIAEAVLISKEDMEEVMMKKYVQEYFKLRKHKGITELDAMEKIKNPLYYAAMMTRFGDCDGFVAGAINTTPNVIRASLHCLELDKTIGAVSSCFIMVVPDCIYGDNGVFVFADCGVMPEPSSKQLAKIAISNALLAKKVLGIEPKVAMLSYSTKGSAGGKFVEKVQEATRLANELRPDLIIDGELQLDAAIVPEVAKIKKSHNGIKGDANVLIFPDLEAGNIGYKLVQRLAKARAIGPILEGFTKPCSDLSRGCEVDDIIDCVAVTAIRANR
ncbi:MAG: phosphate acetyltransferase [Candidatus Gygaella obscura]|nr:phosphate acetyltransferase [Candidatus Gygaella obscura]